MEYEDRLKLVQRIIAGYQIIKYEDREYYVHDPSLFDFYQMEKYYQEAIEKLSLWDFPSLEQNQVLLKERGLIQSNINEVIEKYQEDLKDLEKTIPTLEFKTVEKKIALKSIEAIKEKIHKLIQQQNTLLFCSAEYVAKIEKYKYVLYIITRKSNGEAEWCSLLDFKTSDDSMINHLVQKVFFENNITTKELREIARSDPWRNIWLSATKVSNLFSKPMTALTDLQRELVMWSMIYDSVYESMDTPSQDIIDNDTLLDAWFKDQHEKRQKDRNKNSADAIISKNPKIRDGQEIGIVCDTPEDAEKVYNLNDPINKQRIKNNFNSVIEKGKVLECNLPETKKELMMQQNRNFRDKMNEISKG